MENALYRHPLFKIDVEHLSKDDRVALAYKRARLVLRTHRLSANDVLHCTPKYWALFNDPICSLDIAMFTILAAHVGLAIGTLVRHLKKRPDLLPLIESLLHFDQVGIYLLTERGHGLDAFNNETTATKTPNGFVLHSPSEESWKFMPASTPEFGIPKVALVMARLIVDNEDRGCRFFIVPVCDERQMCRGVKSIRLPPRSGTGPLDFSITYFDQVELPSTAIVSSDISDFTAPKRPLEAWWDEIWRIQLGTLAVPAPWISAMKAVAYIGGSYSLHRTIVGKGRPTPIISFRTQQWPILNAVAVGMVMENWYPQVVRSALFDSKDHRTRHALAVIAKATVCRHFQRVVPEVAERCGAQGTFEYNYMARIENDGKGVIIAEGDVLTLSIRLLSELLQGHFSIPLPDASESLLARHAHSLLDENLHLMKTFPDHRCEEYNSLILPQSQAIIEAIGHAMAYSAALHSNMPQPILDLYECSVIRQDPSWYSENGLSRMSQRYREDDAVTSALPHLSSYLEALNIEKYVSAPIVSAAAWKAYVTKLPVHSGNATPNLGMRPVHAML